MPLSIPAGIFSLARPVDRRDLDFPSQGSGGVGHGHFAENILSLPLEKLVTPDVDHNVEIPGRSAPGAALSLAGQAQARTGFHAGGNLQGQRGLPAYPSLAAAGAAGITDDLPPPPAGGAGLAHLEEAAGRHHLAPPVALAASLPSAAAVGPGAPTRRALLHQGQVDLLPRPEHGLFKVDLQIEPQVFAPGGRLPASAPARGAPEEIVEDAPPAAEGAHERPQRLLEVNADPAESPGTGAGSEGLVPELIVLAPLAGIAEHFVGLGDLLEFLLGLLVAGFLSGWYWTASRR